MRIVKDYPLDQIIPAQLECFKYMLKHFKKNITVFAMVENYIIGIIVGISDCSTAFISRILMTQKQLMKQ